MKATDLVKQIPDGRSFSPQIRKLEDPLLINNLMYNEMVYRFEVRELNGIKVYNYAHTYYDWGERLNVQNDSIRTVLGYDYETRREYEKLLHDRPKLYRNYMIAILLSPLLHFTYRSLNVSPNWGVRAEYALQRQIEGGIKAEYK